MTNYELWKWKRNYIEPDKLHIICMNEECATCPIHAKFGVCEDREEEILEWLNKEVGEDGKSV